MTLLLFCPPLFLMVVVPLVELFIKEFGSIGLAASRDRSFQLLVLSIS